MDHVLIGFLVGLVGFVLEKSPFPPMLRKAKFQRQKQELSDSLEESERKMQISSTSPSMENMPLKKGLRANTNRSLKRFQMDSCKRVVCSDLHPERRVK